MKKIILKSKVIINSDLNLRDLNKINFDKPINSLLAIKALYKRREVRLRELFEVKCQNNKLDHHELVINGLNENCNYVGWNWVNGNLIVNSSVGSFVGAKMQSGKIFIKGSAGNYVGSQMQGGSINISANTSDFVGSPLPGSKAGMSGGVIIIEGKSKDYLGLNMKKGMIYVGGKTGNYCCNNMIAGTVILKRGFGKNLAIGMKRGTIFSGKEKFSNVLFKKSGELPESFFGLLHKYFSDHFGIKIFNKKKRFIRFYGDLAIDGKGELFIEK